MKKPLKIILLILAIIAIASVGMFFAINQAAQEQAESIEITLVDATGVVDGTYDGRYEAESIKVTVSVTVADEKIVDIDILEHENGLGGKAESIIDDVVAQQSLQVDAVSGATVSSKAILKAIENALLHGKG
ncbi:FMN-binding protein [Lachnospiraceae bacterium OttesenSCG-928-D06]|nr:FMN-binding protein [Lachnospiraceae bacterium OttesenSCG-928-D06]